MTGGGRCRAPELHQHRARSAHSISTIMSSALNTSRLGTDSFWARPDSGLHSQPHNTRFSDDSLLSRDL